MKTMNELAKRRKIAQIKRDYKLGLRTRSIEPIELWCNKCEKIIHCTRHGQVINIYQKCDICNKILGVPADARTNKMTKINCAHCKRVNQIKTPQRWLCENGHTFTEKE